MSLKSKIINQQDLTQIWTSIFIFKICIYFVHLRWTGDLFRVYPAARLLTAEVRHQPPRDPLRIKRFRKWIYYKDHEINFKDYSADLVHLQCVSFVLKHFSEFLLWVFCFRF